MRPALQRSVPDDAPASRWNRVITQIANALNSGLSWDNMQAQVITFAVTMPAAYVAATLLNSWAAVGQSGPNLYAVPGFRKDSGRVYLRGAAKSGTYGTSPLLTLPQAYWPKYAVRDTADQTNDTYDGAGRVAISVSGVVTAPQITSVQTGASTFFSLDGISFDAADSTPIAMPAPFPLNIAVSVPGGITRSVEVLYCTDQTGSAPATPPAVTWSAPSPTLLRITNLAGLLPERRYQIRLVVRAF